MALRCRDFVQHLALASFAAVILVCSFLEIDLSFLVWVGLAPILLSIHKRSPRCGFLLSFFSGIVFFMGIGYWILGVPNYKVLHHGFLAVYLGSYFGLFGLGFTFICKRCGIVLAHLAAPFVWVALEFIRSNLSFLALPWGLLAHSQYRYPLIIQFASITGAYGISFLVVMVNSALAVLVSAFLGRIGKSRLPAFQAPPSRGIAATVFPAALLTALALLYGQMVLSSPIVGDQLKVSVVQGNIEQAKKWDPKYARFIMRTYADLTREASRSGPQLIIWPETATPGSISRHPKLRAEVRSIAREASAFLLLGSSQHRKFGRKDHSEIKYVNSAHLICPDPELGEDQRYDKIRLLPFSEYLPLKEIVPWSLIKVPDTSHYVGGKEFTVFHLSPFRFSVVICWEDLFPYLFRGFISNGAQFMVNITNEAWFGKTAAPYQLLSISVFRAIENRIYVVRCANTGISCFIDPYGRIIDRVRDEEGRDIYVQGVLSGMVIPMESRTFYTRYGDWFAWLSLLCSGTFLVGAFIRKKALSTSNASAEDVRKPCGVD